MTLPTDPEIRQAELEVLAMAGRAVAERNVPAFEALEKAVVALSNAYGGPGVSKH